jgi:hypothetical protein
MITTPQYKQQKIFEFRWAELDFFDVRNRSRRLREVGFLSSRAGVDLFRKEAPGIEIVLPEPDTGPLRLPAKEIIAHPARRV